MASVTVEYCGMEGRGKTLTTARQDAARKAEQALTGSYTPLILECRGHAVLIYREPSGWRYRSITDERGVVRPGHIYGNSGRGDAEGCEDSAAIHLAQIAWKAEDGVNVPGELAKHMKRETIKDFASWAKFQLRYQEGRRRGMDHNDAHSYAGCNPARPELWLEEQRRVQRPAVPKSMECSCMDEGGVICTPSGSCPVHGWMVEQRN